MGALAETCTIINGQFSMRLEVDNRVILFSGIENGDYFAGVYRQLGYHINRLEEYTPQGSNL